MGVALVVLGGVAYAQASEPPKATLYEGETKLQAGRLGSYCWSSGGTGQCVDVGRLLYPTMDRVEAGSVLHVRILDERKPNKFTVLASRDVDKWGYPDGQTRRLDTTLRRVVEDGQTVAWDASFRVGQPGRHYYLNAFGIWDGIGDAFWNFHVKTRS